MTVSRKTFSSMRVRGPARFDSSLIVEGIQLPVARCFAGLLKHEGGIDPEVTTHFNSYAGALALEKVDAGAWHLSFPDGSLTDKTLVLASFSTNGSFLNSSVLDPATILLDSGQLFIEPFEGLYFACSVLIYSFK